MMDVRYTPDRLRYGAMSSCELRAGFVMEDLFARESVRLIYYPDVDRVVVGSVVPVGGPLALPCPDGLRAEFFCQRREMGVLNIGGAGRVRVDGTMHALEPLDVLYIGRDSCEVVFESASKDEPAKFMLLSYPAHAAYPTTLARKADANRVDLGADATANRRTIHQYIHEGGVKSCQLVMGYTELATGSVWNTMPPHTHDRRSEVYMYFNLPADQRVLHLMGEPSETRGLWLADGQAVISPSWSIHSGCGTASYRFLWAMGGENQRFDDMDPAPIATLE